MKCVRLQAGNRPRALVFFAGWGMDYRPFRRLTSCQYDVYVCYDYRNLETDLRLGSLPNANRHGTEVGQPFKAWGAYEQVTIVAWSFGCAVAAQWMFRHSWPVHEALAINGTVTPEDDKVGIPRRWMDATAESLLQGGWPKFVRRMCLDPVARQDFEQHAPERDLPGAVAELEVLRTLAPPADCGFTRALIGANDKILLPRNQQRGWERFGVPVQMIAAPHYPFHIWNSWEELLATWDK